MISKNSGRISAAECFKAMLNGEKPERVIYWEMYPVGFAAVQAGKTVYDAYDDPEFSYRSQERMAEEVGWLFCPAYYTMGGGWGGETKLTKDDFVQAPIPVRYAVESEEDAWNLKAPDLMAEPSFRKGLEFYRIAAREKTENDGFRVTFNGTGPFTLSARICGMDAWARWLVKKPEIVHHLLRLTTDHIIEGARLWLEEFGEFNVPFYLGEPMSSNQIISPKQFEEFVLPYQKELNDKALDMGYKHIFCHICGDHNANLPYWAQIPMGNPGIISIGQQIELETAARYFPNDIIFGNLDPVIIQTETPEQIYEDTKQVVEKGKEITGRFIFGTGCELPPRAGRENVMAMMRAVEDYGRY